MVGAARIGAVPCDLAGQTPLDLAITCSNAGGADAACEATSVAARALLGHVGVGAGLGSEVPGTASNLGRRLGTTPRVALSIRAGGIRAALPDLDDVTGLGETSFSVPTFHAGLTLGVFDGFRLMPTVGGFLSLDVFGRLSFLFLPDSEGFDGRVSAWSFGARVGVFREGFTIPGVSVSVSRRFVGTVVLTGDAARLALEPSVTSFRATVGKDLFAVEVMAGVGWDDYSADASFAVSDGMQGTVSGNGSINGSRRLYFVSAERAFNLVFLLSVEVGIAHGFYPGDWYDGDFDATKRSLFGSFAFRLAI